MSAATAPPTTGPEAIGAILARKSTARGPVCKHCGQRRGLVRNSQGELCPGLYAPCLCRWPGPDADDEAREALADAARVVPELVPPAYADARLEDFGYYADLVEFLNDDHAGLFTLIGPTGAGKTRTAYAVVAACKRSHRPCTFWYCPRLLAKLNANRQGSEEAAHVGELEQLLILDDVGAESPDRREIRLLAILLNEREKWGYPTLITTNLGLDRLAMLSERMTSRIAGGRVIELDAPDHRLTTHTGA